MNITLKYIPNQNGAISLPNGCTLNVRTEYDDTMGQPWEEHDGHGPVSELTTRDKRAGERVLCTDRSSKRYYDFAEAMRIARRDGWGLTKEKLAALERGMGRKATKGEIFAAAVESDFEHLRSWCADEWHWIGVIVTLEDADSGLPIATISESQLQELTTHREEEKPQQYYMTPETVEMLQDAGADATLVAALRAAVGSRSGGVTVRWIVR